jgi:phage FluMu protein Com
MWSSSGKKKGKLENPTKIRCKHCKDIIFSVYSGQYVECQCGSIAIDETEYYTRILASREDYSEVEYERS